MVLVLVLIWVKSVLRCSLYKFHLSGLPREMESIEQLAVSSFQNKHQNHRHIYRLLVCCGFKKNQIIMEFTKWAMLSKVDQKISNHMLRMQALHISDVKNTS